MKPNKNNVRDSIKTRMETLNKNTLGIIICVTVLVLTIAVFLITRGSDGSPGRNKTEGETTAKESMTVEDYAEIGDADINAVTTDTKDSDKVWKTMEDDKYAIEIKVLPDGYTGNYLEDGSDEDVKDILALMFTNKGTQDIQYAEYVFSLGKEVVSFKLSNLPAGQSCQVLEASRHNNDKKNAMELISRVVAQVEELPFARDELLVVDNSDNTITIMNTTKKEIAVARVFYKNFDSENNLFMGGITYTAKAEKIPAGGGVTVSPAHYTSGESVVVGSGVYEK